MVELGRTVYSLKIYLRMIPKLTKENTITEKASRINDTYNFAQILTIVKRENIRSFQQKISAVFNRKKLATNVLTSYNMIKE